MLRMQYMAVTDTIMTATSSEWSFLVVEEEASGEVEAGVVAAVAEAQGDPAAGVHLPAGQTTA